MDGLSKQQTPYTPSHCNLIPTVVVYVASVYERLAKTTSKLMPKIPHHSVLRISSTIPFVLFLGLHLLFKILACDLEEVRYLKFGAIEI